VRAPGAERAAADLVRGGYDAVVVGSPAAVRVAWDGAAHGGTFARRARVVAIGPVTAAALEAVGRRPDVTAAEPTDGAVARAVLAAFADASGESGAACYHAALSRQGRCVTADASLRRTPLHDLHEAHGGRMVAFAGWRLPVQYAGIVEEHLRVRRQAGLFDVSHMGQAEVHGPQALAFLEHVTPNVVAKLEPGRAQYNALTTPAGTFVDDILVYRLGPSRFLLVLNAANTAKDVAWLAEHGSGFDVELADVSDAWAQLALQGPRSLEILAPLARAELAALGYYRFVETEVAGAPCLVSRTGYTGEDGFEIYVHPEAAVELWRALLAGGAALGLAPIGLGARDTLRLEAKLALYGNDIDATTTVYEADLGWLVKLDKGEFVGREALAEQRERGVSRKLVGFEMTSRAIARPGYPASHDGHPLGRVTSGSYAPFLEKNIGLIYLPIPLCEPGTPFHVEIRGRAEPAVVVHTPFYRRARGE
jgi:aminomethyltransferase